ncbi:MAG TPA: ABC transporter permease [Candidatus Limnocylindrales bacterium]|nr:ABC transporter permease [Candidatus Limnocylindrales bacterium]
MTTATTTYEEPRVQPMNAVSNFLRRNGWAFGLLALLGAMLVLTRSIQPTYGQAGVQNLAIGALPFAFAAAAQAIIVIGGGIDLSIGSIMALTSVVAAANMKGQSEEYAVVIVIAVLILGFLIGAVNGALIVVTRIPDIIVTLAMSFVWAGSALLVLNVQGGGGAQWLKDIVNGAIGSDPLLEWVPKALIVMAVVVGVIWFIVRRTKLGLWFYSIGSSQLAAFRSGVPVKRAKLLSYAVGGLFAALAGLSLTAATGIGSPIPGPEHTLLSVAAVVLGGVSLAGGRGGLLGPIVAVYILSLLKTDLTFLRLNSNLATVAQGAILVIVVMVGTLVQIRRARK